MLPFVRAVRGVANLAIQTGVGHKSARKIMDAADRCLEGADIIHLPDRFNAAFAEHG